jgi:formamidopyrimidine-DNA glycosylase
MKMTGHVMHGLYRFDSQLKRDKWVPVEHSGPLADPFNRHIRLVFTLSDGSHLVMSDTRRFAKVTLVPTDILHTSEHLAKIGPEPLDRKFTFDVFKNRLILRPTGRIKQVIMDQEIMAGVGNIYADESLWRAGIHPEERVKNISTKSLKDLYTAIVVTLNKGIDFGGDSMSDYRNIKGERGKFQEHHRAYRKTGTTCEKRGCGGTIVRKVVGGRSSHFCDRHQKLKK